MKRVVLVLALAAAPLAAQTPAAAPSPPVRLPPGIVWETNYDDPPIGSPNAIRGGTFNDWIDSDPLTFRLMGPNSNDYFSIWNREFTFDFPLVIRHPVTDNYIPWMATAWSVQDDQRTIYFKLDPDARWSDGEPITADDYVFTVEMMRSEHIKDPSYNTMAEQLFESVDKIDDYTLRLVGKNPSWRPLWDYGFNLWPTPAHATQLDETWVERVTNDPQIAVGPYTVSDYSRNEAITFARQPRWWGDGKHYFQGMFNPDTIRLRIISIDRTVDYLRNGQIDALQELGSRIWNESYAFDAVRNGWIKRVRVFVDYPAIMYGLHMNLEAPIFQNKDFRKAMQHLFNFERLNRNLMFGEYVRTVSFFQGTEFANRNLRPYPFDPEQARVHLERAGYRRPDEIRGAGLLAGARRVLKGLLVARSADDDILVNERGEKASFTVIYYDPGLTRHMTVVQQDFRRAGVEMKLRLLEEGAGYERGLERKFEMTLTSRGTYFFPEPRQYFHTDVKNTTGNNDIWGFGSPQIDSLIQVYEEGLDPDARRAAMYELDRIVQDEAFYIPFWDAPFIRLAYWDYVRWPENWIPKRVLNFQDFHVFWIDPERKAALEDAMAAGRALPLEEPMDKDPYDLIPGP